MLFDLLLHFLIRYCVSEFLVQILVVLLDEGLFFPFFCGSASEVAVLGFLLFFSGLLLHF